MRINATLTLAFLLTGGALSAQTSSSPKPSGNAIFTSVGRRRAL